MDGDAGGHALWTGLEHRLSLRLRMRLELPLGRVLRLRLEFRFGLGLGLDEGVGEVGLHLADDMIRRRLVLVVVGVDGLAGLLQDFVVAELGALGREPLEQRAEQLLIVDRIRLSGHGSAPTRPRGKWCF